MWFFVQNDLGFFIKELYELRIRKLPKWLFRKFSSNQLFITTQVVGNAFFLSNQPFITTQRLVMRFSFWGIYMHIFIITSFFLLCKYFSLIFYTFHRKFRHLSTLTAQQKRPKFSHHQLCFLDIPSQSLHRRD